MNSSHANEILRRIVREIVCEISRIQGIPVSDLTRDEKFPLPRQIAVDGERALFVNKRIDDAIQRIAYILYENEDALRTKLDVKEIRRLTRSAFGPVLANLELNDNVEENSAKVLALVSAAVANNASRIISAMEHCFSCRLFSFDVPAFQIGPVLFETKMAWLERQTSKNVIDKTTRNRVIKFWSGNKLRRRQPSYSSINENDIISFVGQCPYVGSVSINGLSQGIGKERSLLACRIAMTSMALLWETPSKRLDGFNLDFDREPRGQQYVTVVGSQMLSSRSKVHFTIDGAFRSSDWVSVFEEKHDYFCTFGEIISSYLISPSDDGQIHTMMRLFHATMWFHEAARERSPLLATVKFGASMDALANGKKANGILRVFESLLGWRSDDSVFSDETSLRSIIHRIYGQGRSRTMHGNNDQSGLDWSVVSGRAEQLAKHLILGCIDWTHDNNGKDIAALSK